MESPLPVNVVVAKWEPGVKYTGWLGEGSLQRAVYASATSDIILLTNLPSYREQRVTRSLHLFNTNHSP